MAEARKPVAMRTVYYICDSCEIGTMKSTGMVRLTYPEQYEHICSNCRKSAIFFKIYPYVEYTDA